MQPQKNETITQRPIGDYTLKGGQKNKSLEGLKVYTDNLKKNPVTNQVGYKPNQV